MNTKTQQLCEYARRFSCESLFIVLLGAYLCVNIVFGVHAISVATFVKDDANIWLLVYGCINMLHVLTIILLLATEPGPYKCIVSSLMTVISFAWSCYGLYLYYTIQTNHILFGITVQFYFYGGFLLISTSLVMMARKRNTNNVSSMFSYTIIQD